MHACAEETAGKVNLLPFCSHWQESFSSAIDGSQLRQREQRERHLRARKEGEGKVAYDTKGDQRTCQAKI